MNNITVTGLTGDHAALNGTYTYVGYEYYIHTWQHATENCTITDDGSIGGQMQWSSDPFYMPPQWYVYSHCPASGEWTGWTDVWEMGQVPTVTVAGGGAGHSLSVFVGNCTRNLPPGAAQSGTTITLSGDASDTAETGVDGIATFTDLADGDYHLAAAQTGYTFKPAAGIDVEMAGEDVEPVNFYAYTVGQSVGGGKRRRDGNGGPDKGSRRHHPRRMLYMDNGRSWS